MSIAIVHADLRTSQTWRQFQHACLGVIVALAVGCGIYAVETSLLRCEHRFVENPADTITRAVGLAHFSLGWLFLFTSPRLRNARAIGRLTGWTLVGVAFCTVFAWGGDKNPWMLMAFYSFFFIHEACDEAHLFRHSGELPAGTPGVDRFLSTLGGCMALMFIMLIATMQITRGHYLGRSALLKEMPGDSLLIVWSIISVLAVASLAITMRRARSLYGSLREAATIYQPLLAVYAGLLAILLLGSLFGSAGPNLVILVHGMTWLVYTHRRLSDRPPPPPGVWSWLRQTPTGFLTLHVAVTAVVLVLFALRTHVWNRTGLACDLLSKTWFPYWSIMHIAMAFWRAK